MIRTSLGVALLGLAVVACNGNKDGDDDGVETGDTGEPGVDGPPSTVEESLDRLSVDRKPTPRLGPDGDPLPDDHSPLGSRADLQHNVEIATIGFGPGKADALAIVDLEPGAGTLTPSVLHDPDDTEAPWAIGVRGAAAGDVDGDGLDETIVVTWDGSFVQARVIDDEEAGFATSEPRIVADVEPLGIAVEALDIDGDGDDDLAIGLVFDGSAQIRFVEADGSTLRLTGATFDLTPGLSDVDLDLRLASGKLDGDLGEELGLVLNELGSSEARSTYVLLDDASAAHAELRSGLVRNPKGEEIYTAKSADLALGDIDGDGVDEVVFGGLTNVSFGTSDKEWGVLAFALDDAFTDFADFPAWYFDQRFQGLSESGQGLTLESLFVDTLDIDGDGADEIHIQQKVYDDFASSKPWTELGEIDTESLIWESGNVEFTVRSAAMAAGDVTQDGRDDIVFYSGSASDGLEVWGIDATEPGRIQQLAQVDAPLFNKDSPLLVLPDVDGDSVRVAYDGGSYQLVFTEPVVIAALAAPPCNPDWGQDAGSCTTAFGEATTTSVSEEDTYTITAGVTTGFSQSFSVLGIEVGGLEVLQTLQSSVTKSIGETYSLTKRVVHTTGPLEDSVLFTTIPMDQYTYTITSHPNPKLIGGEIVVSTPRAPIEALVTRELFNASILEPELAIDERVFTHQEGDPSSYRSASERDELLGRFDGLTSPEVDVGEGGGNVLVEISVYEEREEGNSYGVDYSIDLKATAGSVVVGGSVGWGRGNTISYASGEESLYQGKVGNLDAANFVDNGYAFGMYTYIYDVAGRQFEVLDYWVR